MLGLGMSAGYWALVMHALSSALSSCRLYHQRAGTRTVPGHIRVGGLSQVPVMRVGDGPCFDEGAHVLAVVPLSAHTLKSRCSALFILVLDGAAPKGAKHGCVVAADVGGAFAA